MTPPVPTGIRRLVIRALLERIESSFPEDWDRDLAARDIVRLWLLSEARR